MSEKFQASLLLRIGAGIALGSLIGYLCYVYIGCNSGTCPITASPWRTMGYFSIMGILLFLPNRKKKQIENKEEEESEMKEVVSIDADLCTGCGKCVRMCPRRILYIDKDTKIAEVTDHSNCDRLRGCEFVCPTRAIKIN